MHLVEIRYHNFRNLANGGSLLAPGMNVLIGGNGSGKTSFLEALHVLSTGKSFRTRSLSEVICSGETELQVFGVCARTDGQRNRIGFQYSKAKGSVALVNRERVARLSEVAKLVPVLFFGGEKLYLLGGAPQARREFLDWGLFHVEPFFLGTWRRYARALAQRNAALRCGASDAELATWTTELASSGPLLAEQRAAYAGRVVAKLKETLPELAAFSTDAIACTWQSGWPEAAIDLTTHLAQQTNADRRAGYTRHGPHRADWVLTSGARKAADFCSAGQQKILICGLLLAQIAVLREAGIAPTLLLDDLPAELDARHRQYLTRRLAALGTQLVVTATEQSLLDNETVASARLFHVEQGRVHATSQ
jgi:DNA replication and repair protein RecF